MLLQGQRGVGQGVLGHPDLGHALKRQVLGVISFPFHPHKSSSFLHFTTIQTVQNTDFNFSGLVPGDLKIPDWFVYPVPWVEKHHKFTYLGSPAVDLGSPMTSSQE